MPPLDPIWPWGCQGNDRYSKGLPGHPPVVRSSLETGQAAVVAANLGRLAPESYWQGLGEQPI